MQIRELNWEMEFSTEERDELAAHGIAVDTLREFLRTSGPQNLDVAIGGIKALEEKKGQERNEPFQTQEEADAQVSGLPPTEQAGS